MRWTLMFAATWLLLAGCTKTPPEQALRETMEELRDAVDQRDSSAVEDHLANDFVGPVGMDRDGANRLAALTFLRDGGVGVTLGPLAASVKQDHARISSTAVLPGGSGPAF